MRTYLIPLIALGVLAACAEGANRSADTGGKARPAAAAPDFPTYTDHFAALQQAALRGNYQDFARHLKANDAQGLVGQLNASFSGQPFDIYTAKSRTSATDHRRIVELRGTAGRLYLFLVLDKVVGGWTMASYDIDRNRNAIITRL